MNIFVEANVKKLFIVIPILLAFGTVMTISLLISKRGAYKENIIPFFYYGGIITLTLFNLIYLIVTKKHPEWSSIRKNFSLCIAIVIFMSLSTFSLYFGNSQINALILFAIVSVTGVTFFTVKPILNGKIWYEHIMTKQRSRNIQKIWKKSTFYNFRICIPKTN